ncbi:MAG: hypothetical protein HC773_05180 [Scytonema sp. CRU_2_7]|nr:hypothetical protein [Scytonema sp. CRU_2_7]
MSGAKSKTTNIKQTVSVTVPAGTSEQQAQFLKQSAEKSFEEMFNNKMDNTLNATPQAEQ